MGANGKPSISQPGERWLPIPGYDSYEVSDFGRIRRIRYRNRFTDRALAVPIEHRHTLDHGGYPRTKLCRDGVYENTSVYSLVMLAFVGPRPAGHDIAHLDGDRENCRLDNLTYATRRENEAHKVLHGTLHFGERAPWAKLTDAQARAIWTEASAGARDCDLAEKYGVSDTTIAGIRTGRRWVRTLRAAA